MKIKAIKATLGERYLDDESQYATHPIDVEVRGWTHYEGVVVYGNAELAQWIVDAINTIQPDVPESETSDE